MSLSERFTSLDPIKIRKTTAREIFDLVRNLNEYTERENKNSSKKKIIKKPANDNWF